MNQNFNTQINPSVFLSLWNSSFDGLLILDSEFKVLEVNEVLCRFLKKKRKSLIGRIISNFITSTSNDQIFQRNIFTEKSKITKSEWAVKLWDGNIFLCEISKSCLQNKNKTFLYTLKFPNSQDKPIASNNKLYKPDYKSTALPQQINKKHLQLFLDNTPDLIAVLNIKKQVIWSNKSFKKIFSKNKISLENPFDIILKEDVNPALDIWNQLITKKKPVKNVELRVKCFSGKCRYFEFDWYYIYTNSQDNFQLIGREITKRKKVENQLEEYKNRLELKIDQRAKQLLKSEETFKALAENSKDIIMRFDSKLRHMYVNPIVEELTGIAHQNFIGKTHKELGFPKKLVELWEKEMKAVFKSGIKSRVEFQLENGIWIDWVIMPEYDEEQNVKYLITSGRDITERKKLEFNILNNLEKEKEFSALKSRFITTASHEFRTPLASILSSVDILIRYGKNWEPVKIVHQLERIKKTALSMTELINDVLLVSKNQNQQKQYFPNETNLLELIKKQIELLEVLDGNKNRITLNYNCDELNFYIDEKLIVSVLQNLLSNALKYSDKTKKVLLDINMSDNNLIIKVSDKGMGVEAADNNTIFEPFHRGANVGKLSGTGLGLSIVRKAVEMHGGKITLKSKLGKGSTFTVFLPKNIS
ncbi:MAG: hypothetical protein CVV23_04610 [Ignavibacteriae bacterium HGW-Ignavibacteriae-2]|jgi:PAS domain S-box-containing protein|nr:MAG: hypothetical protein CVV23_04610 [Ignavibacteriae bacterium HGW-Ignavibacteriae-2]